MKDKLIKQYNDLKAQNEQYSQALQNNHNAMQQIIGKLQLLEEQEKEKKVDESSKKVEEVTGEVIN